MGSPDVFRWVGRKKISVPIFEFLAYTPVRDFFRNFENFGNFFSEMLCFERVRGVGGSIFFYHLKERDLAKKMSIGSTGLSPIAFALASVQIWSFLAIFTLSTPR